MKRILTLAAAAALLASLTACGSSASAVNTDYVYGQIDSVSGNDIVLLLADYNENAESGESDSEKDTDSAKSTADSKSEKKEGSGRSGFSGEKPEGFDPSKMPEGFSRSKKDGDSDDGSGESKRERPEGFDKSGFSGEMPEGFDPSNIPEGFSRSKKNGDSESDSDSGSGESKRERPEGFDKSAFGSSRSSRNSKYTLTGEQEELRISVGTTVTTALGVETDFEVLKSGDMIKCTVEKDSDGNSVITAVWILEE